MKRAWARVIPAVGLAVGLLVGAGCAAARPEATEPGQSAMSGMELGGPSAVRAYALRLRPGADLKAGLIEFARARSIRAGAIVSAAGSLKQAGLRLADQSEPTRLEGKFEIVSLSGTLSPDGVHVHAAIADGTGRTVGGHLADGCLVYTTAEIVIAELSDLTFSRAPDAETGFKELRIGDAANR